MRSVRIQVVRTGQARLSSEMLLSSMQRKRIEDIETFNAGSIRFFRVVFDLARENGIGTKVKKTMISDMLKW